jgi:prepilin-type N-terminal cleavage/methylation domain-containing protein
MSRVTTTMNPGRVRGRRGFTLLELLIAIAAVSLIALGIFQVFRATGETLRTGRRVSAFNAQASLLERQLRDDISRMTRDGFLLIRNEAVSPNGAGVRLFRGQPATFGRPRRADEIVFFARGPFSTRRDPVHPQRVARSNEARIWIGHGLMKDPLVNGFFDVNLNDDNSNAPQLGTGVNQYAGDWTLLRQVALLCRPHEGLLDPLSPPPPAGAEPEPGEEFDSDLQIDLQPAASSLFRVLANENPPLTSGGSPVTNSDVVRDEAIERPVFASGVIDIATTSLAETRSIVLDAKDPSSLTFPFAVSSPLRFPVDTAPGTPGSPTALMQQWMIESLPANSDADERPRYERLPPDLLGVISGAGVPFDRDYKRTDQTMLTNAALATGCSEFIVEWSFGKRIPSGQPGEGQLIWHGLEREADVNGDGAVETVANLYEASGGPSGDAVEQVYRLSDGSRARRPGPIEPKIIHDPDTIAGTPANVAYSFFGYVDPTYQPPSPRGLQPESMPWAWPKLLRITVRLVDPSDPSFEQTYQFIYTLPGDQDAVRQ